MVAESEKPPLIFRKVMGALRPCSRAAEEALRGIKDGTEVRIRITRVTANQKRRGFYWVLLGVVADALQDRHDIDMDAELLHDVLKRKLGLGREIVLPSGETFFKPASTSDRAMSEPDRAAWTTRVVNTVGRWLRVEPKVLLDEARAQDGQGGW